MTPKLSDCIEAGKALDAEEREIAALALQHVDETEQAKIDAAWDEAIDQRLDEQQGQGRQWPEDAGDGPGLARPASQVTRDWNEHPEARGEYFDAAADLILYRPDAPPYRGRRREPMVRTWNLGKFPYHLGYAVREGEICVLAYAHESRRPGYWTQRLND